MDSTPEKTSVSDVDTVSVENLQPSAETAETPYDIATNVKDIESYDPEQLDTKVLQDDWRLMCAHWATFKAGKNAGYSKETIINTAKLIYQELRKRGIKFHPETMTDTSKELYGMVSTGKVTDYTKVIEDGEEMFIGTTEEVSVENSAMLNIELALQSFNSFRLFNECISMVGSATDKLCGKDVEPNDVDILIRLPNMPDYVKRGLEMRLYKMMPEDIRDKVHFIWEPRAGPHDSYVPLFDLKFERILPPKVIKMSRSEAEPEMAKYSTNIVLGKPFRPMKSTAIEDKTLFYDIDEMVSTIGTAASKWLIEKKYDGYHAVLHKKGNEVKLFSEELNDISSAFPTILSEAKQLTTSDFIIEGELVPYYKGQSAGRSALAKFIGAVKTGKKLNDDSIMLHAWDIVYIERSVEQEPLIKRKTILKNLDFTKHIKYVPADVVDSAQLKAAIVEKSNMPDSEGAMVKVYNSTYRVAVSPDIMKYRKVHRMNVMVIKKNPTAGSAWNFDVGIPISSDELPKIMPQYIVKVDGKDILNLHNTFNTVHTDASPGDIIEIAVQEVWRHRKDNKIRYSLHKPRVLGKATKGPIALPDLDKMVVGRGAEIQNASKIEPGAKQDSEGGSNADITDFPKRMIRNFKDASRMPMWLPYVMHAHGRGESYHMDFRHLTPAGYLEGITVDTPGSASQPFGFPKDDKALRCELKSVQPKEWLTFEGIHEPGGVGATKNKPAVFFIVSRGKYRVLVAEDHRIVIEYKGDQGSVNEKLVEDAKQRGMPVPTDLPKRLIQPSGYWLFQNAHIEPTRHIILLKHLKDFKPEDIKHAELSEYISDPTAWYAVQEKFIVERYGGVPLDKKPGPDGVINGRPVEVKSAKKDPRYHIDKGVHDKLMTDGGLYIFVDANGNTKLMTAAEVDKLLTGPWLEDRDYPHKFIDVAQVFPKDERQKDSGREDSRDDSSGKIPPGDSNKSGSVGGDSLLPPKERG